MKVFAYNSRSGELHVWGPCDTQEQKDRIVKKLCNHLDSIDRLPCESDLILAGFDKSVLSDLDEIVIMLNYGVGDCGYGEIVEME